MDRSKTYWTKEGHQVIFIGENWRKVKRIHQANFYDYLDPGEKLFEYNPMEQS